MQLLRYFDPITEQDQSDREKTEPQDTTAVRSTYTRAIQLKSMYSQKATKFCEISTVEEIYGEDFEKLCGLLRTYEL